jgi:hypothetical protein
VREQWIEAAARRRHRQLLSELFAMWAFVGWEARLEKSSAQQARAMVDQARDEAAAATQVQLMEQSLLAEKQLQECELSIRQEAALEIQKATEYSDKLKVQWQEAAIRRMRRRGVSLAFVAWADAAWAHELEKLEEMVKAEQQSKQAAEARAQEEAALRAHAEQAAQAAAQEVSEVQARQRAAEEAAAAAAAELRRRGDAALAAQRAEVEALAAEKTAAEAAAASASLLADRTIDQLHEHVQATAIRRMRHGLVSRVFSGWLDVLWQAQMADLEQMVATEKQARATAEQRSVEAEAAAVRVAELETRLAAEAEAARAAEAAVAEEKAAAQARAHAEALEAQKAHAVSLAAAKTVAEEVAVGAVAAAEQARHRVGHVHERVHVAAIRRMQHGLVARAWRAWVDWVWDQEVGLRARAMMLPDGQVLLPRQPLTTHNLSLSCLPPCRWNGSSKWSRSPGWRTRVCAHHSR